MGVEDSTPLFSRLVTCSPGVTSASQLGHLLHPPSSTIYLFQGPILPGMDSNSAFGEPITLSIHQGEHPGCSYERVEEDRLGDPAPLICYFHSPFWESACSTVKHSLMVADFF